MTPGTAFPESLTLDGYWFNITCSLCHMTLRAIKTIRKLRGKKHMTLQEVIQDIHGLDKELTSLEKRYGLLSADSYHLYKAGEIERGAIGKVVLDIAESP